MSRFGFPVTVGFIEKVSFLYHKFYRLCIHDFMQSSWQRNSENRRKLKVTAVKYPARNHTANVGAAATKSRQSCPTLCDPIDGSPPGSPSPGILQARTLEWVVISFSIAWKWKVKGKLLSHVPLFATPWALAYQAPLSMGFSRQAYWSGLLLPSLTANATRIWTLDPSKSNHFLWQLLSLTAGWIREGFYNIQNRMSNPKLFACRLSDLRIYF